jgi:hypothetical protein
LSGTDKLSRTSRTMFRKAGKAFAGISVELANVRSANEGLQSQLDLKTGGQRKKVTLDPNQTFADINSIKKAQEAAALATAAREAKTNSDEALKLASELAGSLRMQDMMFEFQV